MDYGFSWLDQVRIADFIMVPCTWLKGSQFDHSIWCRPKTKKTKPNQINLFKLDLIDH